MKLSDTREIAASPEEVWAAILSPEVLKECIPGCESLTGSIENGYEAVVKQKVGPVSATFTGLVQLSEIAPGKSLKISGEAKGGADVRFEPFEGGTRLTYEVEANVGGKIAQLGSRIIDSFAKKLADEFFTRFQAAVEEPEEEATDEAVAESGEKTKGWFRRLLG